MQAIVDSPVAARKARMEAAHSGAASPEPPAAVTPMTRGADVMARGADVADAPHMEDRGKASPAPSGVDVSPKVRRFLGSRARAVNAAMLVDNIDQRHPTQKLVRLAWPPHAHSCTHMNFGFDTLSGQALYSLHGAHHER